jgi:hypothetical protein
MCTFITDENIKIADKDIEVYKIVCVHKHKVYAPFRLIRYPHTLLRAHLGTPEYAGTLGSDHISSIDTGIHSFMDKVSADKCCFNTLWHVVKSTIPKGSQYYLGYSDYYGPGLFVGHVYVSDQLRLHPDGVMKRKYFLPKATHKRKKHHTHIYKR